MLLFQKEIGALKDDLNLGQNFAGGLSIQQGLELCQRHGTVVIEALDGIAGGVFQEIHVFLGLHSFCHHGHLANFCNFNQVFQNATSFLGHGAAKEDSVQLDTVDSAV